MAPFIKLPLLHQQPSVRILNSGIIGFGPVRSFGQPQRPGIFVQRVKPGQVVESHHVFRFQRQYLFIGFGSLAGLSKALVGRAKDLPDHGIVRVIFQPAQQGFGGFLRLAGALCGCGEFDRQGG